MELINDNMLAAFSAGVSNPYENQLVMNELVCDEEFPDILLIIDEVDSIDSLDELRKDFHEIDDDYNFNDYLINMIIKYIT